MDLDVTAAKTKFTYVGEILPNNERSNQIIAQRKDEEQKKREEAERVSPNHITSTQPLLIILTVIDQAAAGVGREGA